MFWAYENVRSSLKNIKRQWEKVHQSKTALKRFHVIFRVTQLWWRYLFGNILTFDSFPGPLLSETLAVRNIPLPQRKKITVALSGKVTNIALYSISKVSWSITVFSHWENTIYFDNLTIETNGLKTMKLPLNLSNCFFSSNIDLAFVSEIAGTFNFQQSSWNEHGWFLHFCCVSFRRRRMEVGCRKPWLNPRRNSFPWQSHSEPSWSHVSIYCIYISPSNC